MAAISEELKKMGVKEESLRAVLDSYNHIELTDDEVLEAMIWAKRKKADKIQLEKFNAFQEQNRKLRQMQWNFDMIKTYMLKRAEKIFKAKFVLDDDNEYAFDLFCSYFIGDQENFALYASKKGVASPSIQKGILMCGNYGVGKTWLMKLFSRNAQQSFDVWRAKDISQAYLTSKEKEIPEQLLRPFKNCEDVWYPTAEVFNQVIIGLCIDDLGSEDVKNNYGNKCNVIGDLLETRYAAGFCGPLLHATTNMTAEEIRNFYGDRVASRMREVFNFIELPGGDRRK